MPEPTDDVNQSPIPQQVDPPKQEELPLCVRCGGKVSQVNYLDYNDVRVVMHAGVGCVLGVMKVE